MVAKTYKTGDVIIREGSPLNAFWILLEGSVAMTFTNGSIMLQKGDILGIADFTRNTHFFSYIAKSDCQLAPYGNLETLQKSDFFAEYPDNAVRFALAMNKQLSALVKIYDITSSDCQNIYAFLQDSYASYKKFAEQFHCIPKDFPAPNMIEPPDACVESDLWQKNYQEGIRTMLSYKELQPLMASSHLISGYMYHSETDIHRLLTVLQVMSAYLAELSPILLNESRLDMFDLYTSLAMRNAQNTTNAKALFDAVTDLCEFISGQSHISNELSDKRIKEYKDQILQLQSSQVTTVTSFNGDFDLPGTLISSVQTILDYADCFDDVNANFKNALSEYKAMPDRNAVTPEANQIRKFLSESFYQIYASAFQVSLTDDDVPIILKMFFNFGFVDASLCGMDTACYLYEMAKTYEGIPNQGVYTIYDWLKAIYNGEKTPSINEFEEDYVKHIVHLRDEQHLDNEMYERMLQDRAMMVMYELGNMFPSASKITSGKVGTFCPVLSDHQFIRSVEDCMLHADQIVKLRDKICSIDYSLFYREFMTVYSETERIHDYSHTVVYPDIVLMPVVGLRGAMWQEIGSRDMAKDKTSDDVKRHPARFMLPVFQLENLNTVFLRICAEYRWEYCKRTQGSRWNDVTTPSLTSLYYDYLQFYKKNPDLSPEIKERIRLTLQKCKQSFKQYFVLDYITYITYEVNASPHLNKSARSIMINHCPLNLAYQKKLAANPIYKELITKYNIKLKQQIQKLENIQKKLLAKKQPIPDQLLAEIAYYKQ